jgi:hypothetical protein
MSKSICPGCGLELETAEQGLDERYNASHACMQLYHQLSAFTLSLTDPKFIHQLAVDAYAAQHSGPNVKPISTTFALIGLYLAFERGYTGNEVQRAHVRLGQNRREWPVFNVPPVQSAVTVRDVLSSDMAQHYEYAIRRWGRSVWDVWALEQRTVQGLVERYLDG